MAEKEIPEYGELNKLQTKQTKKHIDISRQGGLSISVLKEAIKDSNTASEISQGPYFGYVIRVYQTESNSDDVWTTIRSFFSNSSWIAKVRIPELHAHIPTPKDFENDYELIEAHTSFAPIDPKMPVPSPGDYVKVEYNGTEGYIVEAVRDKEGNNQKAFLPKGSNSTKDKFKNGVKP